MNYPSFCGGSYTSQSPLADCEQTMNWYPEQIESQAAQRVVLYPTPGREPFIGAAGGITDVGTRALFSMNGITDAVIGQSIYGLFSSQTATNYGTITQDANPATISYNGQSGNQRFYTSGGNGYVRDLTSNVVTQELTGDATMGGMIDGYFLAFNINTSTFRISNLNDGLTWDPTQFQENSITADPWQAMVVDGNRKIWFVGEQSGQIWYDDGSFPFPFVPYPGAVFSSGTSAPFSVKVVGDGLMWLTRTKEGQAQVVRTTGFQPRRVSDHAVETAISGYARNFTINDAEGLTYEDEGHLFYALTFPSANATWVYDVTIGKWHQRGIWNPGMTRFDFWAPRVHCYAFGKHLTGERGNGIIANMDVTIGSELDGSAIRRVRVPSPLRVSERRGRLIVKRFESEFEPGVASLAGQGSKPLAMFRSSQTFGKTWSQERTASDGLTGQRGSKVYWNRCGQSRDTWVPEISVSDPIPWRLIEGYVDGRGFIGAGNVA